MGQQHCCDILQDQGAGKQITFQPESFILPNSVNHDPKQDSKSSPMPSGTLQSGFLNKSSLPNKSPQTSSTIHGPNQEEGFYTSQEPELKEIVRLKLDTSHPISKIIESQPGFEHGSQQHSLFHFKRTNIVYVGEWRQGKPFGIGTSFYPNGTVYGGSFRDGIPHGYGRFIMTNGDSYEGEVRFGRANGQGTYESESAHIIYRGNFKDNLKHLEGEEYGPKYNFKGLFEYGEKREGTLRYEACLYEGGFQNDVYHGKGKLITSEGVYQGRFDKGIQHGLGRFTWEDGSYYEGNYAKGVRSGGYGEYFSSSDGTKSRGTWENGSLNGKGEYVDETKVVIECWWEQGRLASILD